MYFPKPSLNENDLAIIERGDTAVHAIEAGQYVSWKGKLGKAISSILQGATLDDSLFSYETDGVINSLSNKISWHFLGQYSGSTENALPASFNELLIKLRPDGAGSYSSVTIPYDALGDTYVTYGACAWINECAQVRVKKTLIMGHSAIVNGTTKSAVYYVYYR